MVTLSCRSFTMWQEIEGGVYWESCLNVILRAASIQGEVKFLRKCSNPNVKSKPRIADNFGEH